VPRQTTARAPLTFPVMTRDNIRALIVEEAHAYSARK
jgi:hypothetical protein